jgi:hypothetical protein
MKDRGIDALELFGHDAGLLSATQPDDWFVGNSEPRAGEHYRPVKAVEEMMGQFIGQGYFVQGQGKR